MPRTYEYLVRVHLEGETAPIEIKTSGFDYNDSIAGIDPDHRPIVFVRGIGYGGVPCSPGFDSTYD
jgi:hypothetical protein